MSMLFLDVKCHGQPPHELLEVCNPLRRLAGVFIRRGKQRGHIFNDLLLPLRELIFTEIVSTTQFCLRTFTAKCLKNNFRFKLGSESSSFSFRHRNSPFSKIVFYHNLSLESGPNFWWQYIHQFSRLSSISTKNTATSHWKLRCYSICLHTVGVHVLH